MRRSMEEMKKAVIGDKNKKEPKVFIMISTYWKASQLLIDFKPDINTVKKDLEYVMNTVTNFQEKCNQLSYDTDLIMDTREPQSFKKNKNIDEELTSYLDRINKEIERGSELFIH